MASSVNYGVQQYSAFDPRSIPNCTLWLDGADTYTLFADAGGTTPATSTIALWKDKSGLGNNTTSVVGSPTLTTVSGKNAVQLSTGGDNIYKELYGSFATSGTALTMFVVATAATITGTVGYPRLVEVGTDTNNQFGSTGTLLLRNGNTAALVFYAVLGSTVAITLNTPFIAMVRSTVSGTNNFNELAVNGGTKVTNTTANGGLTTYNRYGIGGYISAGATNVGDQWMGQICEVLVYNSILSSSQEIQVEGYLANKWGLKASLPATTPYTVTPPVSTILRPPDLGPMVCWLDSSVLSSIAASSGTVGAGGTVSSWTELINGCVLTVPSTFVGPVSTANGIQFTNASNGIVSGTSQCLQCTTGNFTPVSQNLTVLVAHAPNKFDAYRSAFILGAPNNVTGITPAFFVNCEVGALEGNIIGAYNGGTSSWYSYRSATAVATTAGAGRVDVLQMSTTPTINTRTNGTDNTGGTTTGPTATLGTRAIDTISCSTTSAVGGQRCYDGVLYEILVYNSALSSVDINRAEGYLAWKWGFPTNLASTHPFYKWPSSSTFPLLTAPALNNPNYSRTSCMVRYDPNGILRWAAGFTADANQFSMSGVAANASGNICAVQHTEANPIILNNGDGTFFGRKAAGGGLNSSIQGALVVNYNSLGTIKWAARIRGGTSLIAGAAGVTITSTGNVYVTGFYNGTASVYNADDSLFGTLTNAGAADAFLVKYNALGVVQWAARLSSTTSDSGANVSVDSAENVFVSGSYSAVLTAYSASGTAFGTTLPQGASGTSIFLVKYNSAGTVQWVTRTNASAGNPGNNGVQSASIDNAGNPMVVENVAYPSTASVYNASGTLYATLSNYVHYIVTYDTNGTAQRNIPFSAWVGTNGGVYADSNGWTYATGYFSNVTNGFYSAGGTQFATLSRVGTFDMFVAKYDSTGTGQWVAKVSATSGNTAVGYGVTSDSAGNVYALANSTSVVSAYNASGTLFGTSTGQGIIVIKYASDGTVQWIARGGGNEAKQLASDSTNVYFWGITNPSSAGL